MVFGGNSDSFRICESHLFLSQQRTERGVAVHFRGRHIGVYWLDASAAILIKLRLEKKSRLLFIPSVSVRVSHGLENGLSSPWFLPHVKMYAIVCIIELRTN